MPDEPRKNLPPDQAARERALDASRSILVRAPAGSGKTDLLTRRFLCLLGEVDDPGQIVAITFTKAAAAEMRHRILTELENAAAAPEPAIDPFSMQALAHRALTRSEELGWNLLDLPAQLRISTIDSFCRELALQQPLLSRLGEGLDITEQPTELYRRAARRTLEQIDEEDASAEPGNRGAASLARQQLAGPRRPARGDARAARPLDARVRARPRAGLGVAARAAGATVCQAVAKGLNTLSELLDRAPGAREEALELARFACEQSAGAALPGTGRVGRVSRCALSIHRRAGRGAPRVPDSGGTATHRRRRLSQAGQCQSRISQGVQSRKSTIPQFDCKLRGCSGTRSGARRGS